MAYWLPMSEPVAASRPLSILFLCTSPGWGGLEMYLPRTGPGLLARGHRLSVACRRASRLEEGCHEAGLATLPMPAGWFRYPAVFRLASWIRERAVDVVHVHWSRDLGPAVLATRLAGRGVVVFTEHMGSRRRKTDPWHRFVFARVAMVLAISGVVEERCRSGLPVPPERIRRLYYGLDTGRFDPSRVLPREAGLAAFGLPPGRRFVGMLGRISTAKGHGLLLEAFARLAPSQPDVDLVFFGDATGSRGGEPELAARLEARALELGLADRMHLPGYTPRVAEANALLEVAVVASRDEAFGLTVIEAMAMGRAVVGSASGAIPEVVEDGVTGLLFPPEDPEALSACLARLLTDPDLAARLGAAARAGVLERFSMAGHLDGLEAGYSAATRPPGTA